MGKSRIITFTYGKVCLITFKTDLFRFNNALLLQTCGKETEKAFSLAWSLLYSWPSFLANLMHLSTMAPS